MDENGKATAFSKCMVRDFLRCIGCQKTLAAFDAELKEIHEKEAPSFPPETWTDLWYNMNNRLGMSEFRRRRRFQKESSGLETLVHMLATRRGGLMQETRPSTSYGLPFSNTASTTSSLMHPSGRPRTSPTRRRKKNRNRFGGVSGGPDVLKLPDGNPGRGRGIIKGSGTASQWRKGEKKVVKRKKKRYEGFRSWKGAQQLLYEEDEEDAEDGKNGRRKGKGRGRKASKPAPKVRMRPDTLVSSNFVENAKGRDQATALPDMHTAGDDEELGPQKSVESWIPMQLRMKMLKRDMGVAQLNHKIQATTKARIAKQTLAQEMHNSLAVTVKREKMLRRTSKRSKCSLCERAFSDSSLPMQVTYKAIMDLRKSWGVEIKPNPKFCSFPNCYQSVRVCCFCAQFFDNNFLDGKRARAIVLPQPKDHERALSPRRKALNEHKGFDDDDEEDYDPHAVTDHDLDFFIKAAGLRPEDHLPNPAD